MGFFKNVKNVYPSLVVFAMIRPRGGDFCYDPEELKIMTSDVEALKVAGADGFVFGCLTPDGSVDMKANSILLGNEINLFKITSNFSYLQKLHLHCHALSIEHST